MSCFQCKQHVVSRQSCAPAVQTKLLDVGVELQPVMPVHLDEAMQQRALAARPPPGSHTLELTCLGQVRRRSFFAEAQAPILEWKAQR